MVNVYTHPSEGKLPCSYIEVAHHLTTAIGGEWLSRANREAESIEYDAVRFELNGHKALFRQAKITPKKVGQFVTVWKRETAESEIAPFDVSDGVSFFVVSCYDNERSGVFIFSAEVLLQRKVLSRNHLGGKRAIRVYPPWSEPTSGQAIRTQQWQAECFVELADDAQAVEGLRRLLRPFL